MSGDKGGSPAKQTEVKDNSPWSGAVPYINKGLEASAGLYDQGGPQYYQGNTVAPQSAQMTDALTHLAGITDQFSPLQQDAANTIGRLTGANNQGADNPAFSFFQNIMRGNVDSPGFTTLSDTASGKYLNADNPYFSQMADRVRSEVLPQINGQFSQAGRGVSGLAGRAQGLGLGDAIGSLAYQNYQNERANQEAAAGTLAQSQTAGGNALSGMYNQANADRISAAQLIPQLQQSATNAAQSSFFAGSAQQAYQQQLLDAQRQKADYEANLPYANLKDYISNITAQTQGTGHSETETTKQAASAPWWQQALGVAATGASFFA